jgi:hypothetical protein
MWRRVALVRIEVSVDRNASIIRVKIINVLGIVLAGAQFLRNVSCYKNQGHHISEDRILQLRFYLL